METLLWSESVWRDPLGGSMHSRSSAKISAGERWACFAPAEFNFYTISNVHKVEVQLLLSHFFLSHWWARVAIMLEAKIFGSGWFCLFVLFKSQHQMILVYRVLFWKLFSIIFSKITKQISCIVYKVFWLQCTDCFLCHPGAHDTEWSINPSACETSQHSSFDWGNGHPKWALSCNGVS